VGRVAIGNAHCSLDPQQIVNKFRALRATIVQRNSCFFIARMNGFAIYGTSESDGSSFKEQGDGTKAHNPCDASASASSSSNNSTIIGVVVDCTDISTVLQQYASVRPFDKLYCSYLNTYPWDMQTIQYQRDGVSSDVCMMTGCFKDLHTHNALQPDFDIIVNILIGHFVPEQKRARAESGLLNSSSPVASYASCLGINTHMIADDDPKRTKHKRNAYLRKQQRHSQNALVARLDAVRLYGLLHGLVTRAKARSSKFAQIVPTERTN
jgi:hypothetical protein